MQDGRELPAQVDGIADAGVHAQAPGWDHQVRRIAGDEDASASVVLGHQQVHGPFADMQDLDFHVGPGQPTHRGSEICFRRQRAVQAEVPAIVLHDDGAAVFVGEPVVAGRRHLGAPQKVAGPEEHLAQLRDATASLQRDVELLADRAGAAVAAHEVARTEGSRAAVGCAQAHANTVCRLFERIRGEAKQTLHTGAPCHRFSQDRLEAVLRDDLIGFQRQRAVGARVDQSAQVLDGRVLEQCQWRVAQIRDDGDIHRTVRPLPARPDRVRHAEPTVDLHRACVAAFHLGPRSRRKLALDERGADPMARQLERQGQAHRSRADDTDFELGVHVSSVRMRHGCGVPVAQEAQSVAVQQELPRVRIEP